VAGTQLTPAPSSGPASSTPSTSCAPRTSHPPGILRAEQLLVSLPGIGKARATALLAIAGIPATRRVRSLGRQQQSLADGVPVFPDRG
jgi:hypothetical protein